MRITVLHVVVFSCVEIRVQDYIYGKMGGCAAPFCNNSAKKGYRMKIFPKDSQRRALWEQSIQSNYGQWTATKHACLCEVHFSPEMWEEKQGKRKLKSDAIPRIFDFFLKKNIVESRNEASKEDNNSMLQSNIEDDLNNVLQSSEVHDTHAEKSQEGNNSTLQSNIEDDLQFNTTKNINIINISKRNTKNDINVIASTSENNTECIVLMTSSDTAKSIEHNKNAKKMKAMTYLIKSQRQKINNDKFQKALHKLFNEDQIAALCTKNVRVKNWTNETVQRALKLKFVCGRSRYEELLHQGMPFPSLRTLRRRLEDFKFVPGISEKMFDFLKYKKSFFHKDIDIECGLVFDEMAITSRRCYDPSTEGILGDITFPNESDN